MSTTKRVFDKDLNVEVMLDEETDDELASRGRNDGEADRSRKRAKFDQNQSSTSDLRSTLNSLKQEQQQRFQQQSQSRTSSHNVIQQNKNAPQPKIEGGLWNSDHIVFEESSGSENYEDIDYGDDDDDDADERNNVDLRVNIQRSKERNAGLASAKAGFEDADENGKRNRIGSQADDGADDEEETDEQVHRMRHQEGEEGEDGRVNEDEQGEKETAERCKYWPSCNAGAECPFYHPTKPCRAFPNCRFGKKCMYIHPTCKFAPNCTKPHCPFAHPAAAAAAPRRQGPGHFKALQPPVAPKCKFGFNCKNRMCQFTHQRSELCRFGANCLLETCAFTHPSDLARKKPTSAFKWSAQS